MKKHSIFLSFLFTLPGLSTHALADAYYATAKNFEELHEIANSFAPDGLSETLIVMDDDDTLTQMACTDRSLPRKCQYLGGPAWYAWQNSILKTKSKFRIAENEEQLLDISALLLSISKMNFTDESIPEVLNELTAKKAKLLVLTARGGSNLSATENQFKNLNSVTDNINFLKFISDNSPVGKKSGISSIASPVILSHCDVKRPITYQNGVMYAGGQNKGTLLKSLLKKTMSSNIKNIVFIDDTPKNVTNVHDAFKNEPNYQVIAVNYTKLYDHKNALTIGDDYHRLQEIAFERWDAINSTLNGQLIAPASGNYQK